MEYFGAVEMGCVVSILFLAKMGEDKSAVEKKKRKGSMSDFSKE